MLGLYRTCIAGDLNIRGSRVENPAGLSINATAATVSGGVFMNGLAATGQLLLLDMQISGALDISGAKLDTRGGVAFEGSRLIVRGPVICRDGFMCEGELRLRRAHISGFLDFLGARLSNPTGLALFAPGLVVEGGMFCQAGTVVDGGARLSQGRIDVFLDLTGARFNKPGGVAFDGSQLVVGGPVSCCDGFTCIGEMQLSRANIAGFLEFARAFMANAGGHALSGYGLCVDGGMSCSSDSTFVGRVMLDHARLTPDLDLTLARLIQAPAELVPAPAPASPASAQPEQVTAQASQASAQPSPTAAQPGQVSAQLSHAPTQPDPAHAQPDQRPTRTGPVSVALSCQYLTVRQLRLPQTPVGGLVNLSHAMLDLLEADPASTPAGILADELIYTSLSPLLPANTRIEWLGQQAGYLPQPYQQLASAYRRIGHDAEARTVLLAKERRRRRTSRPFIRLWGFLQDITTGYGYRPVRAGLWLIALLALGTAIFAAHPPAPLNKSDAPQFNPLFYTADLLVPVVTYGQQAAFSPRGIYQWIAYLLMSAGWLLAITIVAGITRALSRS